MSFKDIYNPPGAGTAELGQSQGGTDPAINAKNDKRLRQGLYAGGLYWAWAVTDAFINAGLYGDSESAVPEAVVRTVLVALPTALMFFRKGFVSALALVGLSLFNALGHFMGWMAGDPSTGVETFVLHLVFAAVFARAAYAVRPVKAKS